MGLLLLAAVAQAVVPTVSDLPSPELDPCSSYGPALTRERSASTVLTLDDQVRIADIGQSSAGPSPNYFGLSPDKSHVAFHLKRASPDANGYCQILMVAPLDAADEAIEVDRGGEFIRDDFPLRTFSVQMAGWDKPNTPRWSPDGSWVAYLRREGGSTQIWLADPSGNGPARQATRLPDDVDNFAWTEDGDALVIATRPGIRAQLTAIREEGLRGFLFDGRFGPQFADHPLVTGEMIPEYTTVSVIDGSMRPASDEEAALLEHRLPSFVPANARAYRAGRDGYSAWLEPKFPEYLLSPTRLVIAGPDGKRTVCESEQCEGIWGLWWAPGEDALYILRRTGWASNRMALRRWDRGDEALNDVVITDDFFVGCDAAGHELICAREGSLQPRRIVAIDMNTGNERIIYDPNPEYKDLRLGKVERFQFRNAYGVESFADLVLPPDHRPGDRRPLVVVQYSSFGFLRGGTGDEVPIYSLAARGFAVLSFDRPDFLPAAYKAKTENEMLTLSGDAWADRRQVHSSLEIAIERAVGTGAVDPDRMGISGLSDGSSMVQFAILNSNLFKAAAMGSCCKDVVSYATAAGPVFTDQLRATGHRYFESGMEEFWEPMSLINNMDRLDTPILVQNGDSEYEGGLDVVEALTHHGKPIELYVFPGEPHFKWQPAHRRAMYERNVEWFEFWLMDKVNCDPAREAQYRRWKAMAGAPSGDLQCSAPISGSP